MPAPIPSEPAPAACLHCGSPVPPGSATRGFCCVGCEAVHGLLVEQGLTRYYQLAQGKTAPAPEPRKERAFAWLEPLLRRAESLPGPLCALELDVQGIHCAACVWLMNELFRRQPGGAGLAVDPALGKLRMQWRRGAFDVAEFLRGVEGFGYRFGPSRKRPERTSLDLPIRLGICAALSMNVMLFSVSFYVGLTPEDGDVFRLFTRLSLWLSTAVVVVGGWPFFRSALQGLRRGVLHLDLPIALGILLVFGMSLAQARGGRGDLAYFDTLNTFVTLMLVGRWLQQRVLERNRRFLLDDDGAEGLFVRREEGTRLATVRAAEVAEGDVLVIASGDLVPVDAVLLDAGARVTTDWMTGEPGERAVGQGEALPAGAFNAGRVAVRVQAKQAFTDSPLVALLRRAPMEAGGPALHTRFWDRVSRRWVVTVLFVSALGLALWWPAGPDKALEVAVALLVVTCPCAIGIATPLAYELVQARLRRGGFFIRSTDLLDRLPRVRKVLFDKTGTLTLGRLELVDRAAVVGLTPATRDIAFDLVSRSNHPASRCLAAALAREGARFNPEARVAEHAGQGLELMHGVVRWRLGRSAWATEPRPAAPRSDVPTRTFAADVPMKEGSAASVDAGDTASPAGADVVAPGPLRAGGRSPNPTARMAVLLSGAGLAAGPVLTRDGVPVAFFQLRESVRPDARREVQALQAEGREVWLISGDHSGRVDAMATALGIPAEHTLSGQRPEDKAEAVAKLDAADTLYLGDGVNDSLAFERALCAGTPAIDRPVMPGKSDFFLLGEGLGSIREALRLSVRLRRVVRRLLALALGYNGVAVSVCLAGWMTPLRAAVAMPATSLATVLFTVWWLSASRERAAVTPTPPLREVPV
ncbi:heavy metal translocating P-type ATPase metal-binding domain-containing protein [Comamonas sp. JC664]|uniref:heavy metal translocating P-type ATPase n=1 Tax=Comamonas sp. JC664 TaxID=2801917 RepID=UPI00174DB1FE|nr:heavy metal translocating P-type ATPase metal-binding domain-containing protein [Comamonas sp. JC664]MBL0695727.1 heavy metal translocating P-type ATPase [Comamonas sp. JC664]GHG63163.1 copper-translocating P-type ATPase [Comamonas sp. KCTC 72670]